VKKYHQGIPLTKLTKSYNGAYGRPLKMKQLGFSSKADFIDSLSEELYVEDGQIFYRRAMAEASTPTGNNSNQSIKLRFLLFSLMWFSYMFTVFLSRFGAFLTSLFTFAQQLVQPTQHLVICAHHSSSFSFLPTNCKCFWIRINCFHTTLCCFITLSFAYVISVQMNYTCEC